MKVFVFLIVNPFICILVSFLSPKAPTPAKTSKLRSLNSSQSEKSSEKVQKQSLKIKSNLKHYKSGFHEPKFQKLLVYKQCLHL